MGSLPVCLRHADDGSGLRTGANQARDYAPAACTVGDADCPSAASAAGIWNWSGAVRRPLPIYSWICVVHAHSIRRILGHLGRALGRQCAAHALSGCIGLSAQPVLVPAGIHAIFGQGVEVNTAKIMLDLLIIVVLPTIIGVALHQFSKGRINPAVKPYTAPVAKLCFVAVVMLNSVAIAPFVLQLGGDMLKLVPVVIGLVLLCYAAGYAGSLGFGSRELTATLSYATGMRNISLGIVLAMGYFSPLTAVPVVLSILIQQPAATLFHYILNKLNKRRHLYHTQVRREDVSS